MNVFITLCVPKPLEIEGLERIIYFSMEEQENPQYYWWKDAFRLDKFDVTDNFIRIDPSKCMSEKWICYDIGNSVVEMLDDSVRFPESKYYGQITPFEEFILEALKNVKQWVFYFIRDDKIDRTYHMENEKQLVQKLRQVIEDPEGFIAYRAEK